MNKEMQGFESLVERELQEEDEKRIKAIIKAKKQRIKQLKKNYNKAGEMLEEAQGDLKETLDKEPEEVLKDVDRANSCDYGIIPTVPSNQITNSYGNIHVTSKEKR